MSTSPQAEPSSRFGGADARTRRALTASGGSLALRASTILSTFILTAVGTRELSSDEVAAWFILVSFTALQGLGDLGIMARLTTAVAEVRDPLGSGIESVGATYYASIRSAGLIAGTIAVGLSLVFFVLVGLGDPPTHSTIGLSVFCFAALSLATVPTQGPLRLLHGLQCGFAANLLSTLSNLLVVLALATVWFVGGVSLPVLVVLSSSATLIAGLLAGAYVRLTTPIRLTQLSGGSAVATIWGTAAASSPYLVMAAASVVAFSSDQIVLAILGGSKMVAEYSTSYRLFTQVPITLFSLLASLWPAISNARAELDHSWTRRVANRSWKLSIAAAMIASVPLLLYGEPLISWWTGGTVKVSLGLLVACAAYSIVNSAWAPLHFVLLGQGHVGFMARCMTVMAVLNIAVSVLLVGPLGAAGPVVGSAVSLGVAVLVPYVFAYRRLVLSNA